MQCACADIDARPMHLSSVRALNEHQHQRAALDLNKDFTELCKILDLNNFSRNNNSHDSGQWELVKCIQK